jgi:hypothetical protein
MAPLAVDLRIRKPSGRCPQNTAYDDIRKQAEECRQQAAKAISPLDKETLLRVAEEWIRLAQSTEERRG